MKRFTTIAFILFFCTLARAQEPDVVLTMNSYGPIHIGMQVAEARRLLVKLGRKNLPGTSKVAKEECDHYQASNDLSFMVEHGRIVRIETREQNVVTPSGIRVGTSLERVRKVFGSRAEDFRQHYSDDENDHTIVLVSGDKRFAIRVEGNQTVSEMYVGDEGYIRYAEGCA